MASERAVKIRTKLLKLFDRGLICPSEVSFGLSDLPVDRQFLMETLELAPPRVVESLRCIARDAYAHPEDIPFLSRVDTAESQLARTRTYWFARSLRELLTPDLPLPAFEVIRQIGVVTEQFSTPSGTAITFGDVHEHMSLARHHPLQLRREGQCFLARANGLVRVDAAGGYAVLLEACDHPTVGFEVWVDRTAVKAIPPPPPPET